jgi:hypothetical protein
VNIYNMNTTHTAVDEIIRSADLSAEEAEMVSAMFDGWLKRFEREDARTRTLAVEVPFTLDLGDGYVLAGVVDRIAEDRDGVLLCEWKTTRPPSKNWNEQAWLESLGFGTQVSFYALAAHEAEFASVGRLGIEQPRILVRAAVKSRPPAFWPSERPLVYQFRRPALDAARSAARAMCASLEALIGRPAPWQLPGPWCRQYGYTCSYYAECTERIYPDADTTTLRPQATDPALVALSDVLSGARVVLTASAYESAARCRELFRRYQSPADGGSVSRALAIGTVFHRLLAWHYGGGGDGHHVTDQ